MENQRVKIRRRKNRKKSKGVIFSEIVNTRIMTIKGTCSFHTITLAHVHGVDSVGYPVPFSGPGQDGPPPSTQATLVASPRFAEKGHSASTTGPTAIVEERAQMPPPTAPPSSQLTLVMGEEHTVGIRIPVRGASAEAGPSVPREKRARSAVAVDTPFRNTRAWLQSVEPQSQPQRKDERDDGKRKIKDEVLMEDIHIKEERGARHVSGTSAVDEMMVVDLLGSDEDIDEYVESDGDPPKPPPYEEMVVLDSEPSDSDDKETHGTLAKGVAEDESKSEDEDEDDAERIERMANGKLVAAPVPMPPEPRVTRSKTASQKTQISPRRTRSATQRAASPREYAPPQGTRAARAVRGRGRG